MRLFVALSLVVPLLAGCALIPERAVRGCEDLSGRYRTEDLRIARLTSPDDTVDLKDVVLDIELREGRFTSRYAAPGAEPYVREGEIVAEEGGVVVLGDQPLVPRAEPGPQRFVCDPLPGGGFVLRGGGVRFDFAGTGAFDRAFFLARFEGR